MPLSLLAASEAGITCAHVLPMEPPLGSGGGRCRRWPAVATYVDDHHVPRRLRAVPRRPRNAEGSHGLAGAAILPDARCESGAKERDDAGRAVGAAPRRWIHAGEQAGGVQHANGRDERSIGSVRKKFI